MLRKYGSLALACFVFCACAFTLRTALEQRRLAARLIRLHVVAASDAPEDQARKLLVRDVLLPRIAELTAGCADADAAAAALERALPALRSAAAETLGGGEAVQARLGVEAFPRRDYGSFSLPAGSYRALRIVLGAGAGHNWWCVAFPALCLPAAEEADESARAAGFSASEQELLHADTPGVQLKFRVLDWLAELLGP